MPKSNYLGLPLQPGLFASASKTLKIPAKAMDWLIKASELRLEALKLELDALGSKHEAYSCAN